MNEQLKAAYTHHLWIKVGALLALMAGAALLLWLSDGFPPWAWRFLFQVLPQISPLWKTRGLTIVAPLLGLLLLSISLFIIWTTLMISIIRVGWHCWCHLREQRRFHLENYGTEYPADETTAHDVMQQVDQIFSPLAPSSAQRTVSLHSEGYSEQQSYGRRYYAANATTYKQRKDSADSAMHGYNTLENSYNVTTSNVDEDCFQAPMSAASPAYSAPPRQRTERRVQIPTAVDPRVSMREQLRIVPQPATDHLYGDNDTLPGAFVLDPEPAKSAELLAGHAVSEELEQDLSNNLDRHPADEEASQEITPQQAEEEDAGADLEAVNQPSVELLRRVSPPPTGSALRLSVGVGLDPGIVRRKAPNEDSLFSIQGTRITASGTEPVGLFIIADGMGGHANGREASRQAIHTVSDLVVPLLMRNTDDSQEDSFDGFIDLLKDGVHRANLALYQRSRQQEHIMGTTLTAALVVESTACIVNVGDSRTYLYRQSEGLHPITRDHSIVARMVEDGMITPDDIYTHPKRNQIYRCLGERATVDVDTFVVPLRAGDVLLLCSDGLWEMVRDEDMRRIIESSTAHPSLVSSLLIQAALSRGGADNVSVVVVDVSVA